MHFTRRSAGPWVYARDIFSSIWIVFSDERGAFQEDHSTVMVGAGYARVVFFDERGAF